MWNLLSAVNKKIKTRDLRSWTISQEGGNCKVEQELLMDLSDNALFVKVSYLEREKSLKEFIILSTSILFESFTLFRSSRKTLIISIRVLENAMLTSSKARDCITGSSYTKSFPKFPPLIKAPLALLIGVERNR
ncbi:3358_t:CDS:2, partial [Entrophospora sp. SA101]